MIVFQSGGPKTGGSALTRQLLTRSDLRLPTRLKSIGPLSDVDLRNRSGIRVLRSQALDPQAVANIADFPKLLGNGQGTGKGLNTRPKTRCPWGDE